MSREHWDRVAPVFCVFLTHWDCIYFTKFSESRVMIVALRAPSLAEFGEVDTVPLSEKCDNQRMTRY